MNIYVHIINAQKASSIQLFNEVRNEQQEVQTEKKTDILKFLSENGINVIEIEEGMLGYISNNKIVKLPINKTISVETLEIKNIDIYNEFYKNI